MKIELTKGYVATINEEDAPIIEGYTWHVHETRANKYARGYKVGYRNKGLVYMHRLIMGAKAGQIVDHKDRSGLNNTRTNIRFCTRSENLINTHKNKGYWFDKKLKKYKVETRFGKKKKNIGTASTPEEARKMYVDYINNVTNGFLYIEGTA